MQKRKQLITGWKKILENEQFAVHFTGELHSITSWFGKLHLGQTRGYFMDGFSPPPAVCFYLSHRLTATDGTAPRQPYRNFIMFADRTHFGVCAAVDFARILRLTQLRVGCQVSPVKGTKVALLMPFAWLVDLLNEAEHQGPENQRGTKRLASFLLFFLLFLPWGLGWWEIWNYLRVALLYFNSEDGAGTSYSDPQVSLRWWPWLDEDAMRNRKWQLGSMLATVFSRMFRLWRQEEKKTWSLVGSVAKPYSATYPGSGCRGSVLGRGAPSL